MVQDTLKTKIMISSVAIILSLTKYSFSLNKGFLPNSSGKHNCINPKHEYYKHLYPIHILISISQSSIQV